MRKTVEELVEWFFENYEDPANGVPYESAEGGYQYVFGGPYDAREALESRFPNVSPGVLSRAVEIIQDKG